MQNRKRSQMWPVVIIAGLSLVATTNANAATPGDSTSAKPLPIVPETSPAKARPQIEVTFVLDTTGSMSNLIEGAKRKIWSIANQMASGQPTPEIRMGLVAYRDRGDEVDAGKESPGVAVGGGCDGVGNLVPAFDGEDLEHRVAGGKRIAEVFGRELAK